MDFLGRKITELIFPSSLYCICCGKYIDKSRAYSLCDHCIKRMNFNMTEIGLNDGINYALPGNPDAGTPGKLLNSAAAAMGYGLYERQIIFELKYGGKTYIARHIADILYDCLKKHLSDTGSCPWFEADIILPVPLHKEKLKQRGFNQAAKISVHLGERTGIPVCVDGLERVKATIAQRALSSSERRANVDGAFRVNPRKCRFLMGKRILLIDDIFTTGATAFACADSLMRNGVGRVDFLALSFSGNRQHNFDENVSDSCAFSCLDDRIT